MDIVALTSADPLWDKANHYMDNCGWEGGPRLAYMMRDGFLDWERVFVAVEDGNIAGYCSLQKDDYIPNLDYTPYVRFVFVGEPYRGARLSERLCMTAIAYAKSLGYDRVYLTSDHVGLYEKYGFIKLGDEPDQDGEPEGIFMHDC